MKRAAIDITGVGMVDTFLIITIRTITELVGAVSTLVPGGGGSGSKSSSSSSSSRRKNGEQKKWDLHE